MFQINEIIIGLIVSTDYIKMIDKIEICKKGLSNE